jgi:hypothetical protein
MVKSTYTIRNTIRSGEKKEEKFCHGANTNKRNSNSLKRKHEIIYRLAGPTVSPTYTSCRSSLDIRDFLRTPNTLLFIPHVNRSPMFEAFLFGRLFFTDGGAFDTRVGRDFESLACHPLNLGTDAHQDGAAIGRGSVQDSEFARRKDAGPVYGAPRDEQSDDYRETDAR